MACAVPAGNALAVDRVEFSRRVAEMLAEQPNIEVRREEVTRLDENDPETITVLASGPLTSGPLAAELQRLTGADHLAFYDSIAPIVDASTIDMSKVYMAARWDKGTPDYINCPFTKEEYGLFVDALAEAEKIEAKAWEALPVDGEVTGLEAQIPFGDDNQKAEVMHYFEGCLPIEETARRGRDTLRFGPMKPAGVDEPEDRTMALRGGAVTAGEPARGQLQPGGVSELAEVR